VSSNIDCVQATAAGDSGTVARLRSWWQADSLSRQFWIFFVAAFFFDFGIGLYFFLFNLFLLNLRFDERMMGLVTGALTLGNVVGTIPVGFLARRFGLQKLLLFCFIAFPLISIFRTMAASMPAQIGLAFIAGMALSCWPVCFAPAVASLTTESNRVFAFSIVFATGIGTGTLAGLAGGSLPHMLLRAHGVHHPADGIRLVLIGASLLTCLGIWPVARLKLIVPQKVERSRRPRVHPFLLRFLPPFAIWSIVTGSFIPFAPVFFQKQLGISLQHVGLIFSASQFAQFCAVLMAPLLFRGVGTQGRIIAAQIVAGVAAIALGISHSASYAVVWYLLYTAVQFTAGPGFYGMLMSRTPEEGRSTASAIQNIVGALAGAGSAVLTGALVVRYGYTLVFNLNAILAGLVVLLVCVCFGRSSNVAADAIVSLSPSKSPRRWRSLLQLLVFSSRLDQNR
jgi:MFS family permease